MKYVRIVLAIEDDDLERLDDYMECVIEADEIPPEFRVDPIVARNPIQGAHVSAPYDDRDEAIGGGWTEKTDPVATPDTTALAECIVESEVDHVEIVGLLEPFMSRTAIATLCGRLELCPIHHVDAQICADDNVTECETMR